jgi:hypothetical protein
MASNKGIYIKVSGVGELVRDLRKLGVDLTDLRDAFGEIAAEGERLAKMLAPVRTGHLRGTIKGRAERGYATIVATAVYAGPINYGWPKRNIRGSYFMQRADFRLRPTVNTILNAHIIAHIGQRGFAA